MTTATDPLAAFHPATRKWFGATFAAPTRAQALAWPSLLAGASTLLLAPTGSGKTLAAFLHVLDRLAFGAGPPRRARCRVLYVSPLKALAVDVERNLRAPLAGIARVAATFGTPAREVAITVRTGDTPQRERARFRRAPADILVTTPESLFLLLTSGARETLRSVETVIVDEIHALVPTKRGSHLALSLERLERLLERPLQRVGLSATQRPLEEVARFLGGARPARIGSDADDAGADVATTAERDAFGLPAWRPVTIVDAGEPKRLELDVEVPVEDMARLSDLPAPPPPPPGSPPPGPRQPSIWQAIEPRLLELILAHRSTLVFVNARRTAEKLAAALNERAGETLVYAHHGSIARAQRQLVEERLKAGSIKGLVATSSLELGIDMGAIDLVVQIETPPSVASGLQRIGRASHQVGAASRGVIFPKYRGDLVACAALTRAMREGAVESTRYPRNPLDVLAQQIVAMVAVDDWEVDALFDLVRAAAPFAELPRASFEGVLDMLSGRYPSDEFAELRPRLTWDRLAGTLQSREGARRVAIANAGTIPDRGLFGVYLDAGGHGRSGSAATATASTASPPSPPRPPSPTLEVGEGGGSRSSFFRPTGDGRRTAAHRVGELDEEMVFESKVGDTFLLGATTWRIEAIHHDRVLVSPAPGEPGRMPFWKADNLARPLELGQRIGRLVRELAALPPSAAIARLTAEHDLDERAAGNLVAYLADQQAAATLPDERTVVIERCRDELGDWRVCVLSPFGGQVLAPWVMAASAQIEERLGVAVESLWTDDGFVVRMVDTDAPFDPELFVPPAAEVERLVMRQLGGSALFSARFRETAGRALLLPRRRPGARSPLWQLRKRAADLLAVAANYGSFPMLLETYRECLRDVFDLPALTATLAAIERREIRVVTHTSEQRPSPFASAVLFGFVGNFLYDGELPLAERRAAVLSIDHAQLAELLGDVELRELLDADVLAEVERELQHLAPRLVARSADGLHDLLLRLGDLDRAEIAARSSGPAVVEALDALMAARRVVAIQVPGLARATTARRAASAGSKAATGNPAIAPASERFVAVEHAAQYRDALGVALPAGLPEALLAPTADPLLELLARYARTHGPFTVAEVAARYPLAPAAIEAGLRRLAQAGRLLDGAFRPTAALPAGHPTSREHCAPDVLTTLRRRSLAKLRREIAPVPGPVLARLVTTWQGVTQRRRMTGTRGLDALLDVVESLAGAPLPASILEREILPARLDGYRPEDLDTLAAAGEVVWMGLEPLGERDGRIALYLADQLPLLARPATAEGLAPLEQRILDVLGQRGALFFPDLRDALGGGFPGELVDVLWGLVWRGLVTNDGFRALRAWVTPSDPRRRRREPRPFATPMPGRPPASFRSRRTLPPGAEGRFSAAPTTSVGTTSPTERAAALARQLLARYGVVARGVAASEQLPGGFAAVYEVLARMEEAGRIRRGYFASDVGAIQFALPGALDLLRTLREPPTEPEVVVLAATDPANPYGTLLRWPEPLRSDAAAVSTRLLQRAVGARVVLVDGAVAAYLPRGGRTLLTFLPEDEVDRARRGTALAAALVDLARRGEQEGEASLLLAEIDGAPAARSPLAPFLLAAGYLAAPHGLLLPRRRPGDPLTPAINARAAGSPPAPAR